MGIRLCDLPQGGLVTYCRREKSVLSCKGSLKTSTNRRVYVINMPSSTTVELWMLYAFGILVTTLRTYARISAVGFRELRADDYLIWLAMVRNDLLVKIRRARN